MIELLSELVHEVANLFLVEFVLFKNQLMGHVHIDHRERVDAFGLGHQPEIFHFIAMEEQRGLDVILDLVNAFENVLEVLHDELNGNHVVLTSRDNQVGKIDARLDEFLHNEYKSQKLKSKVRIKGLRCNWVSQNGCIVR